MEHLSTCLVAGTAGEPEQALRWLTDDEVESLTIGLSEHLNATNAWLLTAVGELERRRIPERKHVLHTKEWLGQFCRMTRRHSARLVKDASGLVSMPSIAKRANAGEIPSDSVSILVAARSKHPEEFALFEEVFAESASALDAQDLRTAVNHWKQQVDQASALHDIARRRDRRRMSLSTTFDGMWRHDADYDPESGHIIAHALREKADAANLDPDDHRTHPQRMVDALVDVCRFYLDHAATGTTSGGEKPHVTVTVEYDQLVANIGDAERPNDAKPNPDGVVTMHESKPVSRTASGGKASPYQPRPRRDLPNINGVPVDYETMRRIACDSGIVRMIVDGEGLPLDVGRKTRTIPGAIRRALDARDAGCRWRGCTAHVAWTDAHHVKHWAMGGVTSLGNLILLCRRHHTVIHNGTVEVRLRPVVGGPTGLPPPER